MRYFYFKIAILITAFGFSQSLEYTPLDEAVEGDVSSVVALNDKSFFIEQVLEGRNVIIKEISKENLKVVRELKVTKPILTDGGELNIAQFRALNDRIYYVYYVLYRKAKKYSVYARLINNDGSLGERILIDERIYQKAKNVKYSDLVCAPIEGDRFLVYKREPELGKGKSYFTFSLFDKDLKKIQSKTFTLPYNEKAVIPHKYMVKGDVLYFFGIEQMDAPYKYNEKMPAKVFGFNFKTSALNEFSICGDKNSLFSDTIKCLSYHLTFNRNNEPVFLGLYTKKISEGKLMRTKNGVLYKQGVCFATLSNDLTQVLSKDIRTIGIEPFSTKNMEWPDETFTLDNWHFFDDGSMGVLLKQDQKPIGHKEMVSSNPGFENDILFINIGTTPDKRWLFNINKRQTHSYPGSNTSTDNTYFGYMFIANGNTVSIFVNSKRTDLKLEELSSCVRVTQTEEIPFKDSKIATYQFTILNTGVVKFNESEEANMFCPRSLKLNLGENGFFFTKGDLITMPYYGKIKLK